MNIANRYSLVIKQMRQERRTRIPFGDRAPTRADLTTIAAEPITLDPRLELLKNDRRFAKLLRIDDPVEQDAVLEAMQTLITRCGYHQRSAQSQQGMINRRAVRNWRAAQHPARRRGRPLGAQNFAARQFGLGLAMIWWEHTGRGPSGYERGRGDRSRGGRD